MKRLLLIFTILAITLSITTSVAMAGEYTDPLTNVHIIVPDSWRIESIDNGAKFSDTESDKYCTFTSEDRWDRIANAYKSGKTREDIDILYYDQNSLKSIIGLTEASPSDGFHAFIADKYAEKTVYNSQVYYKYGSTVATIHNAYSYTFDFPHDSIMSDSDITEFMKGVSFDAADAPKHVWPTPAAIFLLYLLITAVIQPLPVWLFRHKIYKKRVNILIAFLIAFIGVIISLAVAMVLDSDVNYYYLCQFWALISIGILTSKKQRSSKNVKEDKTPFEEEPLQEKQLVKNPDTNSTVDITETKDEVHFCSKCGAPVVAEALYCKKCGNKVR